MVSTILEKGGGVTANACRKLGDRAVGRHPLLRLGFVAFLNDPLTAKLRGLVSLTYAETMLTQFAMLPGGEIL